MTTLEDIMPFIMIIILGVSVCTLFFGLGYLRYKERMTMIEKDLTNPLPANKSKRAIRFGFPIMFMGIGLLTAFLLDTLLLHGIANVEAIYFSCVMIFGGIGFIIAYFVSGDAKE